MNYFFVTPQWLKFWYRELTWDIRTRNKELFLTFDDGPVPGVTPFVLEELEKVQARATFFCVGENIKKYPSLFKEVISGGHEIGNHTNHHVNGWEQTTEAYVDEVKKCQEQILLHKEACNLFRPPYGRIRKAQVRKLHRDYRIIMWSHLSGDFDSELNVQKSVQQLKKASEGAILVFHDSLKAQKNMTLILPEVLSYFTDQGYTFKTL